MHEMTPPQARDRSPRCSSAAGGPRTWWLWVGRGRQPCRAPTVTCRHGLPPDASGPLPTVVLFHGGGWVIGDLETHDTMARAIARRRPAPSWSRWPTGSPPRRPFPAAVDDALAATRWAPKHLSALGGDAALAVAGDSAGGNLAAVVALRDAHRARRAAAGLPGDRHAGASTRRATENGAGYFLETADDGVVLPALRRPRRRRRRPAVPVLADDLAGRRPAVVVTAEYDPLRDEGEAYAAALAAAGVRVEAAPLRRA